MPVGNTGESYCGATPTLQGALQAGGGCSDQVCCDRPLPSAGPGVAVLCPLPLGATYGPATDSYFINSSGTTTNTGGPVLSLNFTLDLSELPDLFETKRGVAFLMYFSVSEFASFTITVGTDVTTSGSLILSPPAFANLLAAAGNGAYPVQADLNWSTPPASRDFTLTGAEILLVNLA